MSDLYKENKAIIVIPEVLNRYRKMENTALSTNSFGMFLRMKFIKSNLILRRSGTKKSRLLNFQNSLTEKEIKKIMSKSQSANYLRNGVFFKKGKMVKGVLKFCSIFLINPSYILQKIKSNSGLI